MKYSLCKVSETGGPGRKVNGLGRIIEACALQRFNVHPF